MMRVGVGGCDDVVIIVIDRSWTGRKGLVSVHVEGQRQTHMVSFTYSNRKRSG